MKNNPLDIINQIKVEEVCATGGELDYVLIEDTLDNAVIIFNLGVPASVIVNAVRDGFIEISHIAFNYLGADYYDGKKGFVSFYK